MSHSSVCENCAYWSAVRCRKAPRARLIIGRCACAAARGNVGKQRGGFLLDGRVNPFGEFGELRLRAVFSSLLKSSA